MPELYLLLIIFGLAVGSFGNNLLSLFLSNSSIDVHRSTCFCGKRKLTAGELVPVLSYLWLKGRCTECGETISPRYPIVELLSSLVLVAVYYRFGISVNSVLLYIQIFMLMLIAIVDFFKFIIPDILTVVICCTAGVSLYIAESDFVLKIVSAITISVLLYAINAISEKYFTKSLIGIGDIKLIGVLFLCLSFPLGFSALWLSAILGIIFIYPIRLFSKRIKSENRIPFAFFLSIGYSVHLLYADILEFWSFRILYANY